jgi:hypothetical protein
MPVARRIGRARLRSQPFAATNPSRQGDSSSAFFRLSSPGPGQTPPSLFPEPTAWVGAPHSSNGLSGNIGRCRGPVTSSRVSTSEPRLPDSGATQTQTKRPEVLRRRQARHEKSDAVWGAVGVLLGEPHLRTSVRRIAPAQWCFHRTVLPLSGPSTRSWPSTCDLWNPTLRSATRSRGTGRSGPIT